MKLRADRGGRAASGERGFALIAILSLAALVSAFLIASALNLTSAGVSNEREQRSMNALRQAKAALIAYAASEQWQKYKGEVTTQPGALPCPDILHDGTEPKEGDSDCVLPLTSSLIGRLPFKTLGINDLRDASGEKLWYALSANFRKASGTTFINSDTQPCDTPACSPGESHLTVTGIAPASNVVAIVFAPGEAILGQSRSSNPTDAAYNNLANYLENFSLGDGIHFTFATTALPSAAFNDRLLVITQAELMAAVEPVVAARMERDIKPYIQNYFTSWGIYPFAVPFSAPPAAQSSYQGASSQTYGLLPITTDSNFAGWFTSSINVTKIADGTGSSTVTSNCAGSTVSQIVCQIDYSGGSGDRPDIQLQATLRRVARSFLRPAVIGDESMTDNVGNPITWSSLGSPPLTPTVSNTLQAGGDATVIYTGRLRNAASTGNRVFITVPVPYNPITDSLDATAGWFIANQWYRQTYYAVSPGHVLGGSPACPLPPTSPTSSCLTVNNLPAPSNNNQAILVFAGRALNGSTRPSGTLTDYLEGQNATPADLTFEHRAGVPTAINDRIVVVSP